MTFRSSITRTLTRALVVFAAVATTAVLAGMWAPEPPARLAPHAAPADQATPTRSPAAELVRAHGCWSGDAPADMVGKLPGHVVVTTRTGVVRYAGSRMVGQALEQLPESLTGKPPVDHGLRVHGFCR